MARRPPEPGAVLFAALVGVTLIGPLSVHLFFPALPFVRRAFAVEAGTAQLAFSLSMLAMAAGTLVYGALADRIGRLPTLIGGLALFSGGAAIGALAPSIELLIAGRVLQGLGAACGVVLARTMVSDVYGEDRLPQMIAYLTTAYVLGPMLAPAIGGGLADTLGWQSIMTVPAVFGLATILLAVAVIGETRPGAAPGPRTGLARGFARLLGRRRFVFHMLNPAFGSATFMSANAGAAYLMVETLGTSGTEYGLWFALGPAGFMLGNFLSGRASGRLSAPFLIVTGTAITLAGALTLADPRHRVRAEPRRALRPDPDPLGRPGPLDAAGPGRRDVHRARAHRHGVRHRRLRPVPDVRAADPARRRVPRRHAAAHGRGGGRRGRRLAPVRPPLGAAVMFHVKQRSTVLTYPLREEFALTR